MKHRFGLCILLVLVGVALGAWAQDEAPAPPASPAPAPSTSEAPTQTSGPKPEYTQVDPGKSLDFLGEAVAHSTLNLGMLLQAAYDTNIAAFSPTRLPQSSYLIGPHIGISQYRSKLALNMWYDGGFAVYTQLAHSDTYSQTGAADVLYQLTSRWQVHANDQYIYSANPFGSYYTLTTQPSPNDPNPNTYVPFAVTEQNIASLDVSNQLSKYDTLTFSGNETFRRYSNFGDFQSFQTGLYNLVSFSGGANYSHRMSAQLSVGAGYNFTSLDFSHGQQRSGISAIQLFGNYLVSKSLTISGWAGPEHITAKTILAYLGRYYTLLQADWVPAFGVNVGWQGLRQSFTVGFSRQVSDGGGLLATTTVYSVNGAYRRQLSRLWDGWMSVQYGNNASFAASNLNKQLFPDRSYTLLQGIVQLDRTITPQLTAHVAYSYIRETQMNIYVVDASPTYNDSRIWISLQYAWNHPLGR